MISRRTVLAMGMVAVAGGVGRGPARGAAQDATNVEKVKMVEEKGGENGVVVTCRHGKVLELGKENDFEFVVQNNLEEPLEYYQYTELKDMGLEVKRDGRAMAALELYQSWSNDSTIDIRLKATKLEKGQEMQVKVNLTRLFDLSVSGEYEVTPTWKATGSTSRQRITVKGPVAKVKGTEVAAG